MKAAQVIVNENEGLKLPVPFFKCTGKVVVKLLLQLVCIECLRTVACVQFSADKRQAVTPLVSLAPYGNAFEDFFQDLMCLRYPDFADVRTA